MWQRQAVAKFNALNSKDKPNLQFINADPPLRRANNKWFRPQGNTDVKPEDESFEDSHDKFPDNQSDEQNEDMAYIPEARKDEDIAGMTTYLLTTHDTASSAPCLKCLDSSSDSNVSKEYWLVATPPQLVYWCHENFAREKLLKDTGVTFNTTTTA